MYNVKCKASCCSKCAYCARASAKERDKSRGSRLYFKSLCIKICQKCFWCHSIVLCPICSKCQKCCTKSSCRGQTSKLLENLAEAGCQSESSAHFARGLHPPLSDPPEINKDTHRHELLCQSSQEQLPVGGIASAYRQKRCRTGLSPDLFRVLQPTISSAKTQSEMEANSRPKQSQSIPQGGEIQNGDTGNHQNITPERGVGHLSRFQRRLLPYTNTGTITKVPKISHPESDISIQGSALWSVHSTYGVHCTGKRGETDGQSQGYKNPLVPRRLVGESQFPLGLSPAYANFSRDVPGAGLVGQHRQIRAGAKASFQLRRLPVRSQIRPGQTDTGSVAKPSGQDTQTFVNAGLSGPAVHVPDRFTHSHGKTGSPRSAAYESSGISRTIGGYQNL